MDKLNSKWDRGRGKVWAGTEGKQTEIFKSEDVRVGERNHLFSNKSPKQTVKADVISTERKTNKNIQIWRTVFGLAKEETTSFPTKIPNKAEDI
ncbi:hypothetical protein BaRGS_00015585 [Batillaria attramentaria]|uniref:Uncharacterized protein n=1 Tax=Batillaria attramentaria TaxID=370345 RepID=A0ABD0L1Z9_9CAEN